MPYVVTEYCKDCVYTDCVTVCPVDCFYDAGDMLYIHPDECIDCGACEPECPTVAIWHEDELPAGQEKMLDFAKTRSTTGGDQNVTWYREPLANKPGSQCINI